MQSLIYLLFLSIFTIDFLLRKGLVSRAINLVPDMLSIVALVLVIALSLRAKAIHIGLKYLFVAVMLVLVFMSGIILNGVEPTTTFVALRTYLRYLPFFLLPIVYGFSEVQIAGQLKLLLALSLIQLPVAAYQRLVESRYADTGDWTRGTLDNSGILSVYLICAIGFVTAFYFRRELKRGVYLFLLAVLALPTFINETKATLVLLPFAVMVPAVLAAKGGKRFRLTLLSGFIASSLLVVFVPIYDHFVEQRWGYGIIDFLTMQGRVERYLAPTTSGLAVHRVGRIDGIVLPVKTLSEDPTKLMLGLGIGNVSVSFLGKKFSGAYLQKYGNYVVGSVSRLLWETGVLGTALFVLFWYMVLREAMALRKGDGFQGAFGLGWVAVLAVAFPAFFYVDMIASSTLSYLFWFYCGYVVAVAARVKQEQSNVVTQGLMWKSVSRTTADRPKFGLVERRP